MFPARRASAGAAGARRRKLPAAAAILFLVTLPTAATVPPPAARAHQVTPIKSGVSLVSVDFLALGRDGRPITDLKAEEVTLKVGGRVLPVQSLNLIDAVAGGAPTPISPLPPPFGTNIQAHDSRAFVLVVDNDSFRVGTEHALREAADTFLDNLAPTDRVALVTMPYGGTKVDLTTEQEKVRASLAQVIGQGARTESADEMACRTRRTLESLNGLMQGFAGSSTPVTVAFFSASMVGPNQQVIRSGQAVATCALPPETWQQVGAATAAGGTRLYIIEPVGMANQVAGLDHLAGVTGGSRLSLGGAGENAFTRILRETSSFYRIAFEPEPSQRNGNVHRLELRVSHPDVTLRVRPSVTIPKTDARSTRTPKDLLREATVFRDLPLRVTAFASQESGQKKLKVVALAEAVDPSVTLTAGAVALVDTAGRMEAQATVEPPQLKGGPVLAGMLATPGVYRVRFAATDDQGRAGTVDYELNAELRPAGSLQLSDLVLGLSRGGFVPRMQFGAEPVALAIVEIYGGKPGQQVAATFELARTLNGPPLLTVAGVLAATGDHHSATAAFPIGSLPPGDYCVRAIVGATGEAATRVERTLRKNP
jgi:VWFA-related protein